MNDTVTFVHLTDLHVNHPDVVDPGLSSDTSATLRTVVAMINAMKPPPAFVIASGDITNLGDEQSFRHARSILAELDIPVVHAVGNHDTRAGYNAGMLDKPSDAPCTHDRLVEGVHVVVLDSTVPGKIGGALGEDQFAFLDAALGRHLEAPKLIVVHHPPAIGTGHPIRWERLDQADTDRLGAMIAGRNVSGILCGHVHYDRVAIWNGVPVVISTGLHNANDIMVTDGLRMVEGSGFALCRLRGGELDVSFVQLPSTRRELVRFSASQIAAFE